MASGAPPKESLSAAPKAPGADVPFGVNEVRLNARQWLTVGAILALVAILTPRLWERIERFETGPDYRIPYQLSKDYWLYSRRLAQVSGPGHVMVLGDSVVWGEYVLPAGTLSHFLDREAGTTNRFINAGVNGLFPLALEGLVRYYGSSLRHQKVLLHCNLLWQTSPKADLSSDKEESFNHSRLVPQFRPRLACYRADASERLSAVIERNFTFFAWISHLQNAYFGQKSVLQWTLEDDGSSPPRHPNSYRNPLAQITLAVPAASEPDPQRGPASPRHKPWSTNGQGTAQFEWVGLESSLQWAAFQRAIQLLRQRDNEVFVLLGPFNEHMMVEDNCPPYRTVRDGIAAWLAQNNVPCLVPKTLPSALYADASHPLTEGYGLLARELYGSEVFREWLGRP
jgi:hypothetical protein